MLLRLQPGRDERAALAFEEVASGLDSGLPPATLGGDPAAGDRVLPGLFARRRIELDPWESLVLEAAWRSGKAPAALRHLGQQRSLRATFARQVGRSLLNPAALLGTSLLVSLLLRSLPGLGHLWIWVSAAAAGLVALAVHARASALRPRSRWHRLPWVGDTVRDLAELPYLEVLRGLYGAGVPLLQAHRQAVAACPVAPVRLALEQADAILQQGRPLTEALQTAVAAHPETRQLLAAGERAGALEDALGRALERRRAMAALGASRLLRAVAVGSYALAAGIAVFVIVGFYSGYASALRGLVR